MLTKLFTPPLIPQAKRKAAIFSVPRGTEKLSISPQADEMQL